MRYCPISTFINKILTQKYKATNFLKKTLQKRMTQKLKNNAYLFAFCIKCACCLVKKQDLWVPDKSSRYRYPLFLSTRHLGALFTDPCFITLRASTVVK